LWKIKLVEITTFLSLRTFQPFLYTYLAISLCTIEARVLRASNIIALVIFIFCICLLGHSRAAILQASRQIAGNVEKALAPVHVACNCSRDEYHVAVAFRQRRYVDMLMNIYDSYVVIIKLQTLDCISLCATARKLFLNIFTKLHFYSFIVTIMFNTVTIATIMVQMVQNAKQSCVNIMPSSFNISQLLLNDEFVEIC